MLVSSAEINVQERTPLPEGTIPVGIALLIAGVATYAFFKVGTVAVGGADEFAPIAQAMTSASADGAEGSDSVRVCCCRRRRRSSDAGRTAKASRAQRRCQTARA